MILWMGGEDTSFPYGASVVASTVALYKRAHARCAVAVSSTGAIARSKDFEGGAITSGWASRRFFTTTNGGISTGLLLVGLVKDSTSNSGIFLGISPSTTGKMAIINYDGTTKTVLASETGVSLSADSVIHALHLSIEDYGTTSTIRAYLDNNLIVEFSGDCTISGVSSLGAFAFSSGYIASYGGASECFVSTDDSRSYYGIATLAPSGSGDANAWTGDYSAVDEAILSDADFMYTNSTDTDAQMAMSDPPSGNFSVAAMKLESRACKSSDSTPGSIGLGIKSGGTIDPGSAQSLTTVFCTYERLMLTNPVTGIAFSTAELISIQHNKRAMA